MIESSIEGSQNLQLGVTLYKFKNLFYLMDLEIKYLRLTVYLVPRL